MVQKLFETYLEDPQEYAKCERFWREIVTVAQEAANPGGAWNAWNSGRLANGHLFEPGRPIVDGVSMNMDKAFAIDLFPAIGDGLEIGAFVNVFPDDRDKSAIPSRVLTVTLSLSSESVDVARQLLEVWMNPSTTVDMMRQHIDSLTKHSTLS